MKLWIVIDRLGWGFSHNIVRANTPREAITLIGFKDEHLVELSVTNVEQEEEDLIQNQKLYKFQTVTSDGYPWKAIYVSELPPEGESSLLWCHEHSPDSRPEHD